MFLWMSILMNYKLRFHELALEEWHKLDNSVRVQFKQKLIERLESPHVPSATLSNMQNCYKIKLQKVGYRFIYHVDENIVSVTVIAVGKRANLQAYVKAKNRV